MYSMSDVFDTLLVILSHSSEAHQKSWEKWDKPREGAFTDNFKLWRIIFRLSRFFKIMEEPDAIAGNKYIPIALPWLLSAFVQEQKSYLHLRLSLQTPLQHVEPVEQRDRDAKQVGAAGASIGSRTVCDWMIEPTSLQIRCELVPWLPSLHPPHLWRPTTLFVDVRITGDPELPPSVSQK